MLPLSLPLAQSSAEVAATPKVEGYDAVCLSLAQQLGMRVITWDDELRIRGSAVHSVHAPNDMDHSA